MISANFWSRRTQKVVDLEIEDSNSAVAGRRPRASCPKRQNCALNRPRGHGFWHFFKILWWILSGPKGQKRRNFVVFGSPLPPEERAPILPKDTFFCPFTWQGSTNKPAEMSGNAPSEDGFDCDSTVWACPLSGCISQRGNCRLQPQIQPLFESFLTKNLPKS